MMTPPGELERGLMTGPIGVDTRRLLIAGAEASLIAGIPAGLAARAAMAILAGAGGTSMMAVVGQVTIPGTLRIVIVPMIFGIPFAWLLLAVGRKWAGRPRVVRAVAYAVAAFLVPGLLFLTDSELKLSGPNSTLGPWLFVPPFLIYGAVVGLIGDRLLGRTAVPRTPEDANPPA
jgi:hypothetical protein